MSRVISIKPTSIFVCVIMMAILAGCIANKSSSVQKLNSGNLPFDKSHARQSTSVDGGGVDRYPVSSYYFRVKNFLERLGKSMAFLYPYTSPFLWVMSVLLPIFLVVQFFNNQPEYFWMWNFCLWLGWVTSVLVALTGYVDTDNQMLLLRHRASIDLVFWLSSFTLGFRLMARRWISKLWSRSILFALSIINGLMVFYTLYLANLF